MLRDGSKGIHICRRNDLAQESSVRCPQLSFLYRSNDGRMLGSHLSTALYRPQEESLKHKRSRLCIAITVDFNEIV
jgi:hypothetical protein